MPQIVYSMRMKVALLTILLIFSAVTNAGGWRSIGDLEFLNGTSLETTRKVIKTIDRSLNVLGYTDSSRINTGTINRGVGNAKSAHGFYSGRKIKQNEIPFVLQEIQDTTRYIKCIN